ncbi:MAG: 2-C-methyl-D-erythritol 4-phosphate cytidylyltransferase [Clostridiales bacterium]|nr:2-C-methyl-D-erythritol 4-phosphate cytidylyltransferase [Clostridiales bacterium]
MKRIALIFAGGYGQRIGSDIPKQFLKICGREIIIHTLELFELNDAIDEIYVVCIEDWIDHLKGLLEKYDIDKVSAVVPGGETGQDSIFIGLSEIAKNEEDAIVLLHDGVRPLVTESTIKRAVESTEEFGSAVPVIKCFETPIISADGKTVGEMPDRRTMYLAQAPQGYHLKDIYGAHLKERQTDKPYEGVVDSCGLMFKHGYVSHMIEGDSGNIKVTTPTDFYTLLSNLNIKDYEQISVLNEKN